jgi:hypothetical protein
MPAGHHHLHIGKRDAIAGWLGGALGSALSGAITIDFAGSPAVKITARAGDIAVDLLQPRIFRTPQDETGLFDKLKTASEFGRRLSDRGVTLSFLRQGKEAVRLGRGAHPTLSKLVSRSDDIQVSSVRELARLKGDLKS